MTRDDRIQKGIGKMTKTAAIIGGGVIGGGWAARFLLNGWNVCIFDPAPDAGQKIAAIIENARHALPMLYDVMLPAQGQLTFCDTIAQAVSDADWVQESVSERLDLKHQVLGEILQHSAGSALIGSSTSGFKPSQLQQGLPDPGRIFVAHPFNPVYLLPVVEIVASSLSTPEVVIAAKAVLEDIGMRPLVVRKEIDAHIADRLLEAVWREALWLVKDDIATTEEIDDVIRYGFGIRWAQMGLFETYRVAGGDAGMKHFISQFGPCLKWPWTKLMDVPELTNELIDKIASQSDDQSGHLTIRQLERLRDDNLVAIMRALKGQDSAVGAHLNNHEAQRPVTADGPGPITTIERTIPVDWADYNGHMNESRYGQVFSDAADAVMAAIGADRAYVDGGLSYFTVDIRIRFLAETHAGQKIIVRSRIKEGRGKKMRLFHEMVQPDGTLLATGEQVLIHVDLGTRRACDPVPHVLAKLKDLANAHAAFALPSESGGS